MFHIARVVRLLPLFLFLATPALSRNVDKTLGLIQRPNCGVPVITTHGRTFEAILTSEATLTLCDGTRSYPVSAGWTPLPGGRMLAECSVDPAAGAGRYALRATNTGGEDVNERAVYILESFPEQYVTAHITDTHIGTTRHPRASSEIIGDVLQHVDASEASFALITGDLTENGTPEQFREFIQLLNACNIPTFVVPGNHDRADNNYELFFGSDVYAFQFGLDGYLGFDTKEYLIADEMGEQDGFLHFYRRRLRSSRWSVGFTHRYDVSMGMRAQITLFVDDPLDYLLYGHYHREAQEGDGIPWGRTEIILTPAAINGQFRFVLVDAQGLHPQDTETVAATDAEAPST